MNLSPLAPVLLGLVATSCSATESFRADHSLLVPWSVEAHRAMPDPPYAARYRARGKPLTYIASRHEHQPGNVTFQVVSREFDRLQPDVVIIEGLTRANGFSPAFYRDWVAKMPEDDVWPGGEAAWAASLASARGIPFVGGEPTPAQIREGMASSPFELRDLLCYFVVRQVPQWKRTGQDEGRTFAELFAELLPQFRNAYELDDSELFDVGEFLSWYKEKNGRPFVYEEITTQEAAPLEHEGAFYTNRISVAEDIIRNSHISDVVAEMLNRYERVLIVYGAGHHVQQAEVLDDMLGPPLEIEPATTESR